MYEIFPYFKFHLSTNTRIPNYSKNHDMQWSVIGQPIDLFTILTKHYVDTLLQWGEMCESDIKNK